MIKVLLLKAIALVAVVTVSVSLAGDKNIIPPSAKDANELIPTLKKMDRNTAEQFEKLPLIHVQKVTADSSAATVTHTFVMVDSVGAVIHFRSLSEYVVMAQFRAHWLNGTNTAAQALLAAPVSDSSFRVLRFSSLYWDTISVLAVGARRIR